MYLQQSSKLYLLKKDSEYCIPPYVHLTSVYGLSKVCPDKSGLCNGEGHPFLLLWFWWFVRYKVFHSFSDHSCNQLVLGGCYYTFTFTIQMSAMKRVAPI